MMIPPTLILNGMDSLCRLCLGAPIYFNRVCNITPFWAQFSQVRLWGVPLVLCILQLFCYFVCLFPSFSRCFLIAEIPLCCCCCCCCCFVFSLFAAKVSFLLHVFSFTGSSELVNNWKGCLKHVRQHHGGWYRGIEKGVVFKTMSWKIFFVVVNVFKGFRYRLPHDCHY